MSTHGDGGKGSQRRPGEGYQEAWERIFGGKKKGPLGASLASAPSAPTGQSPAAIVAEKCSSQCRAQVPPLGCGAHLCTHCTQSALSSGCTVGAVGASAAHPTTGVGAPHSLCIGCGSECVQAERSGGRIESWK